LVGTIYLEEKSKDDADAEAKAATTHLEISPGKSPAEAAPTSVEQRIQDSIDEDEEERNALPDQVVARAFVQVWYTIRRWVVEPFGTLRRFLYLAFIFGPVILTSPIALGSNQDYKVWWYNFLVKQMERAGPSFIKLGQWAASRTDIFPTELCSIMSKMHSSVDAHPFRHTKKIIERAFEKDFDDIFLEFEHDPIGVGAIAQVYRATLKPDVLPADFVKPKKEVDSSSSSKLLNQGRASVDDPRARVPSGVVAMKVIHPNAKKIIKRDLQIMMIFAKAINLLPGMSWLSLPDEVRVFGEMMMMQLDLRIEAGNLETFEDHFKTRHTVSFPRPLTRYTTRNVLIEEYEKGAPLKYFLKYPGGAFDEDIAGLGLDAFLKMLLLDNFIHADLHPGNIMVKFHRPTTRGVLKDLWSSLVTGKGDDDPEGTLTRDRADDESSEAVQRLLAVSKDELKWKEEVEKLKEEGYEPQLVFIDTGLVTELNEVNRKNFLDLFRAVAEFDGFEAGRLMVERCRSPEMVLDPEVFALKMQHLILTVKSSTFSLAKIRIANVLSEVLSLVRNHHVRLEGDFVNVVVSILLLEGIGRQLDPELDLFASALPILRQLGAQAGARSAARNAYKTVAEGKLGPLLKTWAWIEARSFAATALAEMEGFIRYDWWVFIDGAPSFR